jgi:hypothetical protein
MSFLKEIWEIIISGLRPIDFCSLSETCKWVHSICKPFVPGMIKYDQEILRSESRLVREIDKSGTCEYYIFNGKKHGRFCKIISRENLVIKCRYRKGLLHGQHKQCVSYNNRKRYIVRTYNMGILEGPTMEYIKFDGEYSATIVEGQFQNNKCHGEWKHYMLPYISAEPSIHSLKSTITYDNGKKIGIVHKPDQFMLCNISYQMILEFIVAAGTPIAINRVPKDLYDYLSFHDISYSYEETSSTQTIVVQDDSVPKYCPQSILYLGCKQNSATYPGYKCMRNYRCTDIESGRVGYIMWYVRIGSWIKKIGIRRRYEEDLIIY